MKLRPYNYEFLPGDQVIFIYCDPEQYRYKYLGKKGVLERFAGSLILNEGLGHIVFVSSHELEFYTPQLCLDV